MTTPHTGTDHTSAETPLASVVTRSAGGGFLMGLANLVPGISGGTMLLAAGIYPRFIDAVAEITTFRFRRRSVVVLGVVVATALVSILTLAGTVKDLVVEQRWIMYSLFVGLTLGGVPVVWELGRPGSKALWTGAAAGFAAMAALALIQQSGAAGGGGGDAGFLLLFFAGVAGAGAMILPGVSGGYLLLVLGVYVQILGGLDAFKSALSLGDLGAAMDPALSVMLPVGAGVLVGTVSVSNVLKWLLHRYHKATVGFLLGLLVGAVVGLWPYQRSVEPIPGVTIVKGQVVTAASISTIKPEDLPTEYFRPNRGQVAGGLLVVALGFAATLAISRLGRTRS